MRGVGIFSRRVAMSMLRYFKHSYCQSVTYDINANMMQRHMVRNSEARNELWLP